MQLDMRQPFLFSSGLMLGSVALQEGCCCIAVNMTSNACVSTTAIHLAKLLLPCVQWGGPQRARDGGGVRARA